MRRRYQLHAFIQLCGRGRFDFRMHFAADSDSKTTRQADDASFLKRRLVNRLTSEAMIIP